jgi:hypothetical protein
MTTTPSFWGQKLMEFLLFNEVLKNYQKIWLYNANIEQISNFKW